MILQELQS